MKPNIHFGFLGCKLSAYGGANLNTDEELEMVRLLMAALLAASLAVVLAGLPAQAGNPCTTQTDVCVDVPEANFHKGTIHRPPDFHLEFCVPDDIWEAIDERGEWILRLMTFDSNGNVRWSIEKKLVGQQCVTQGVYAGTTAAVYVTCDFYTGWISTGAIRSAEDNQFHRVDWDLDWKSL